MNESYFLNKNLKHFFKKSYLMEKVTLQPLSDNCLLRKRAKRLPMLSIIFIRRYNGNKRGNRGLII